MMRPKTSEPGMFSTHSNPAGESEEEYEDADSEYDYADADDGEEEDEGEEEEEEGESRSLRRTCVACGASNRLRPPKGFLFSEEEDEDAEDRQIRYRCTCGEINRLRVALARESQAVRTFREAYRRHA